MANKTSIIIKSVDQENKATSRSVTDVSKTATDQQLKAFAQALNATSTNTYTSSSRVQTTDLDDAVDKSPRNIALWKGNSQGENYETIQPAMSNADKNLWFDIRYDGQDPCYIAFGNNGESYAFKYIFGGDTIEGSNQYAGVSWQMPSSNPFGDANSTIKIYVPETNNYQSAELEITITGGNP